MDFKIKSYNILANVCEQCKKRQFSADNEMEEYMINYCFVGPRDQMLDLQNFLFKTGIAYEGLTTPYSLPPQQKVPLEASRGSANSSKHKKLLN